MPVKLALLIVVVYVMAIPQCFASELIGKIIATKNKVELYRGDERLIAKRRSDILNKDNVVTGDDARVNFRLVDGTQFMLGSNSQLEIGEYLFSPDKVPSAVFKLAKGAFRAITGEMTKNANPAFKVITPMGVIGIRGTDFWGGYLEKDELDVLFIGGEHNIVVENMFGKVTLTEPGTGVTIKPGKAPTTPKKWPDIKVQRALDTIDY